MSVRSSCKGLIRRYSKVLVGGLVVAPLAGLPNEASAQGLFDTLFGAPRPVAAAPAASTKADAAGPALPAAPRPNLHTAVVGRSVTFCVRLCDGRFFPMQHHGATAAQTCNALCPASTTRTFSGSAIASAVAADGSRYSRLDNAFVYRDRLVPGCTCNGKDNFGLARIPINADTTVRAGDIVATQDSATVVRAPDLKSSAAPIAAKLANR